MGQHLPHDQAPMYVTIEERRKREREKGEDEISYVNSTIRGIQDVRNRQRTGRVWTSPIQ